MSQDNFFPHVGVWVHEYLLESVNRKVNDRDTFWCSSWWKHAEAVERLTALWITWEQARNEPETLHGGGIILTIIYQFLCLQLDRLGIADMESIKQISMRKINSL